MKALSFFTLLVLFVSCANAQYFSWAKQIGGSAEEYGYAITFDNSGNIYTAGIFNGTADFDPGSGYFSLTAAGSQDIFIQKLDANGNFEWAKAIGSGSTETPHSITTDNSGNVYTTGEFWGTADFDPGPGTYPLTQSNGNIFISKLDSSGNFLWAISFGSSGVDIGNSIAVDDSGYVYTTGYFYGTVDFDPDTGICNLISVGGSDVFVLKLDSLGNLVWAKAMGSVAFDNGYSIAVDDSGNVYTTGYFNGTVDFDPGVDTCQVISAGNSDIFIQKLDASGGLLWAKAMGGTSSEESYSIAVDDSGNVYTTGYFGGTADFDPGAGTFNLTVSGGIDIFCFSAILPVRK